MWIKTLLTFGMTQMIYPVFTTVFVSKIKNILEEAPLMNISRVFNLFARISADTFLYVSLLNVSTMKIVWFWVQSLRSVIPLSLINAAAYKYTLLKIASVTESKNKILTF